MKEFLYNSWLRYDLSQMSWFRKWYGGEWTRVGLVDDPSIKAWMKGFPNAFLSGSVHVIETEKYEIHEEKIGLVKRLLCKYKGHDWETYTVSTGYWGNDIEQAGYCRRCKVDTHGEYTQ